MALPSHLCHGVRIYFWPARMPLRLIVLQMISPSRQKLGHQRCPDKYWFIYTFFFLIKSLRKWSFYSKSGASHDVDFEEHCERVINLKSFLKRSVCVYTAYVCHNLFALCQIISSCEWNCKYITTHLFEITSMGPSCLFLQLPCKTCHPQVRWVIGNTWDLLLSACITESVKLLSENLRCGSRVLCLPPRVAGETGRGVYFVYWDAVEDWKCWGSFKAEPNVLSLLPARSFSLEKIPTVCRDYSWSLSNSRKVARW